MRTENFFENLGTKLKTLREVSGLENDVVYQHIDAERLKEIETGKGRPIDVLEFYVLTTLYHADATLLLDCIQKDTA